MLLYHTGPVEIRQPDIRYGRKNADFGQGFYLTSSREQAQSFAKISTSKAVGRGLIKPQRFGIVSTYVYEEGPELSIKDFPSAGVDWLHCVAARSFVQRRDDQHLQHEISRDVRICHCVVR